MVHQGMSMYKAAKVTGIPKATIIYNIKHRKNQKEPCPESSQQGMENRPEQMPETEQILEIEQGHGGRPESSWSFCWLTEVVFIWNDHTSFHQSKIDLFYLK